MLGGMKTIALAIAFVPVMALAEVIAELSHKCQPMLVFVIPPMIGYDHHALIGAAPPKETPRKSTR